MVTLHTERWPTKWAEKTKKNKPASATSTHHHRSSSSGMEIRIEKRYKMNNGRFPGNNFIHCHLPVGCARCFFFSLNFVFVAFFWCVVVLSFLSSLFSGTPLYPFSSLYARALISLKPWPGLARVSPNACLAAPMSYLFYAPGRKFTIHQKVMPCFTFRETHTQTQ